MSIQWNTSNSARYSDRLILEQLWYTWSTIGLGPLSAGFRIRAASPGLSDVSSPRVQALDRYLRYVLPTGTDPFAITPDMAPICLSLIQTEGGERLLVNKTYTGRDGVGRPGAFFVHLLANLPPDFSVAQAISLWRSPLLQSSDIDRRGGAPLNGVQLDSISFDELKQWFKDIDIMYPRGISSSWMQDCFPLVIRAYLMWRKRWEQWKHIQQPSEPPRLYLAAPSDMVAACISGITRCLPSHLLADLTFSTYEHDTRSKDQVLLVGTSWAPLPNDETHTQQDLPAVCYQEGVAINCYTYDESKTRLENDPLAISFATYATQCLVTGNFRELDWLFIEKAAQFSSLSTSQFLQIYDSYIVKAQNPTQKDVELYLENADIDMLSRLHVQDLLFRLATDNPRWLSDFLQPQLTSLYKRCATNPKLADPLAQLAKAASQKMALAVSGDNIAAFDASLNIISCIAGDSSEAWRIQPRILAAEANIGRFLARYTDTHFILLSTWKLLRPPFSIDEIRPFLTIPEPRFADFYHLDLRPEWKTTATLTLASSAIAQNNVLLLGQRHQNAVATALQQFSLTSWLKAVDLFGKLAQGGYPDKIRLLSILLNAPSSDGKESELLSKAYLKENEREDFLIQFGPRYLLVSQKETCILELYQTFAIHSPRRKMLILDSWLQSPALVIWFEAPLTGPSNMEKILRAASLTPDEGRSFIEHYGKHYLERYSLKFPMYRLSPLITDYLRHYIVSFSPNSLWRFASPAREFLLFLGGSPLLQSLPERERQKVRRWCDFCSFLHHPSTRLAEIREFSTILQELRSHRDPELIETLAQSFASCITSETELASVTYIMSTLLTEAEMLQMLYALAESMRDGVISPNLPARQRAYALLLPFIRFALCLESIYTFSSETTKPVNDMNRMGSDTWEQIFLQMFFYILLQAVHPETIVSLDKWVSKLSPRYSQKWLAYKSLLTSTSAHQRVETSLVDMRFSQPVRSGEWPLSNLNAFLAHPSSSRKELKELGDILPDQYSRRNLQLIERLARAFASCIASETELVGITSMMSTILRKAELLQLLYGMAESIRDDIMNPQTKEIAESHLESYVKFVLCFESVYDLLPDEYTLFARSFFNLLLASADESALQQFNTANWPDKLLKKWQTYMPQYYALSPSHWNDSSQRQSSSPSTTSRQSARNLPTATTNRSQQRQEALTDARSSSSNWLNRLSDWLNADTFGSSKTKYTKLKKQKKQKK